MALIHISNFTGFDIAGLNVTAMRRRSGVAIDYFEAARFG